MAVSLSWFVVAAWNRGFGGLESDSRVRAVTERLVRGAATAAERKRSLHYRVRIPVPVDERDVLAVDQVRAVLPDFDRHRHSVTPSSASQQGSRRSLWSFPSCRAAIPSPRPATAG